MEEVWLASLDTGAVGLGRLDCEADILGGCLGREEGWGMFGGEPSSA
jgi:hypothetical protein